MNNNGIKKMTVVTAKIYLDEVQERGEANEYGTQGYIVYKGSQWLILDIASVGFTKKGRAYTEMLLEFKKKVRGIMA